MDSRTDAQLAHDLAAGARRCCCGSGPTSRPTGTPRRSERAGRPRRARPDGRPRAGPPGRRGALREGATTACAWIRTGGVDRRPARRHRSSPSARAMTGPSTSHSGARVTWWRVPSPSRARPGVCQRTRPASPPRTAADPAGRRRSRPPAWLPSLVEALDAELVPMGSAGVK